MLWLRAALFQVCLHRCLPLHAPTYALLDLWAVATVIVSLSNAKGFATTYDVKDPKMGLDCDNYPYTCYDVAQCFIGHQINVLEDKLRILGTHLNLRA